MTPVIVIPAYNPGPTLLSIVQALDPQGFSMIIVNDGSDPAYAARFVELTQYKSVSVLNHATNLGKGQALKTAFHFFITQYPVQCPGIVTADADGQHLVQDIQQIAKSLVNNPDALTLGVRRFSKGVPLRSRLGNKLTRAIFRLLLKKPLQDTQTGLRAIPREFLKYLITLPTSGYDFELDMLISATKQGLKILEIPIETIYFDANQCSHFNPFVDSLKIYSVFLKSLCEYK